MSITLDLHVVLSFQDVGVLCNLVTSRCHFTYTGFIVYMHLYKLASGGFMIDYIVHTNDISYMYIVLIGKKGSETMHSFI